MHGKHPEILAIVAVGAMAGYATVRAARTRPAVGPSKAAQEIVDATEDVVALYREQFEDFRARLTKLEQELAISERERLILLKWNNALVEQVLGLGKAPVSLQDIRQIPTRDAWVD